MEKSKVFENELGYIKNEKIRMSAKTLIELLPDYFFHAEASTSTKTKHHPLFALGDGGLVRHTKVAVRILLEILNNPLFMQKYTLEERDLMIMGLLVHDGLKQGKDGSEGHTVREHPTLIKNYIIEKKSQLTLTDKQIEFLCSIVESHMGPWNTDKDQNEILPVPKTKCERLVHFCDYLASRKFLDVKFDEKGEITDNIPLQYKK